MKRMAVLLVCCMLVCCVFTGCTEQAAPVNNDISSFEQGVKIGNISNSQRGTLFLDSKGSLWGAGGSVQTHFKGDNYFIEDPISEDLVGYADPFFIAENVADFAFAADYCVLLKDGRAYINDNPAISMLFGDDPHPWMADPELAALEEEVVLGSIIALENVVQIHQSGPDHNPYYLLADGTLLKQRSKYEEKTGAYKAFNGLCGRLFSVVDTGVTRVFDCGWLKNDGELWSLLGNAYGQLGNGKYEVYPETGQYHAPAKLLDNVRFATCDADKRLILAITEDDVLYAWGDNEYGMCANGQAGDGYPETLDLVLEPNKVMEGVDQVYSGLIGTVFARTKAGELYAWGNNKDGRLGLGISDTFVTEPTLVMSDVASFSAYGLASFAIKNDKTLWAWGETRFGQSGTGTCVSGTDHPLAYPAIWVTAPTLILSDVVLLSSGTTLGATAFALTGDGSIYGWGLNPLNWVHLGNHNATLVPSPTLFPYLRFAVEGGDYILEANG